MQKMTKKSKKDSYLRHLFEYIGTQFPPPSSLLYGKVGSIYIVFSNGNIKYDTTFYALTLMGSSLISHHTAMNVGIFVRP